MKVKLDDSMLDMYIPFGLRILLSAMGHVERCGNKSLLTCFLVKTFTSTLAILIIIYKQKQGWQKLIIDSNYWLI